MCQQLFSSFPRIERVADADPARKLRPLGTSHGAAGGLFRARWKGTEKKLQFFFIFLTFSAVFPAPE